MDGKAYPYLELASLPLVGETLLDPRPAFVFAADGSRLLFANAAAVAFFGARGMAALLDLRFSDLNPLKSQAARLSRVLPTDTARLEMLRLGQGANLATLPAACRRLNLADDARAVLAIAAGGGGTAESVISRAERLADVIGGRDTLAAVMNAEGKVLAASGGYDELAPAEAAIDAMIASAQRSGDRLAKQRIEVGREARPAGAVRFRSDGRDFFLLIVGPVEGARAVVVTPPVVASAPVIETPSPVEDDIEAAAMTAGDAAGISTDAGLMFPDDDEDDDFAGDEPPPIEAKIETPVVRFVFETDADGRFGFVSPELAVAVGDENGALTGLRWADVARVLGFGAAAFGGDAFDVNVDWPAGGGETVAVGLAGTATLDRERKISGYRGFGKIQLSERRSDVRTDRTDLNAIARPAPVPESVVAPTVELPPVEPEAPVATPAATHDDFDHDELAQHTIERGGWRERVRVTVSTFTATRRDSEDEPPAITTGEGAPSNIVRLPGGPPSRTSGDRLTGTERDAFRRIAEALGARRGEQAVAAEFEAEPAHREPARIPPADVDTRLLDRVPIGIVLFRDRRTIFANRTLLELLGYESQGAFADAGGTEAIFPGRAGLAGNIAEAGGRLAASRRDGTTVAVKAWLHAVSFSGSTALMLSLATANVREDDAEDATVLEMARIEARAEELEAILNTATDGVLVIDGRGKIGSMNRAAEALFGVEAGQYLGRYFTDLLADESQKAALDYLDGLAANGVASVLNDGREVIGRVPAGGLIPLFMTMGRLGVSDKFCAVLRDITHWKNVEEELIAARRAAEAANAQKSDFLAKISHEIRTPLNAIIGFSEVMIGERFGPVGNERYRSYLHDIHVSGEHLLSLINDLLDLSKIEAGKLELSFESVPVNAAIQECVALMQPQANRERIIIRTSLSADVPSVVADQRSFRQILLNLLSNAVKFTRAGGQVIVSSSLEASGEVVVRIRDTGIGMSEKDIETALKPFRQVAVNKDDREHGTGLGLPLTKALVEANRATFAIDSAVNQGTLVRITFPTTRVLAG